MSWRQLVCHATSRFQDEIVGQMEAADAVSITWQDAEDDPILEPLPGEMRLWDNLVITALYEEDADLDPLLLTLEVRKTDWRITSLTVETVEDQPWERAWMDSFQPMCFGKRLWIYPSWHELPDDSSIKLLLDPGLAFGTGTHPTTALCLEWLDGQELVGKEVLDYGCGSGILAIAALKLGANLAVGVDIDPQALQATHDNAERNGVQPVSLPVYFPQDLPDRQYDIVMANILAGPLQELAPALLAALRPGGHLVLSGILAEQADGIRHTYQAVLNNFAIAQKEGWIRVTGTRR
ncbi:50S ribosomal protein L11 methyltransferase [Candidatus Thiothrix sp. Deng01]|uniref:Ribosomal protein L11 methyltransferase n=1 Tax=Candidatus Thiothrix phosphatis TaxID=3112415 RepID=A0ABU6D3P1_9GAMM|nr:50S ribosomal protein L11 methyltransferase [Candidatus Thiothrix sp. Deng01]MEB4592939.1 50S ribosomal protein L11 methyltransferase [Candidatus Thiothrix sp. Deng01]